ncbi:MAG: ATPase, T2SS/T4P/T4SS family [Methylococcales bacterium]|nr:ATPase, T2SS/T4P/T4SS family [Methylococcales bacterium]
MTEQNELITSIFELLKSEIQFSDIRLESDAPLMIKTSKGWVDSNIIHLPSFEDIGNFLANIEPDWEKALLKGSINRPLDLQTVRLRINAYLAFGGKKLMASIRRVPMDPPTIQETGLPASVRLLLENTSGIILLSGPTGSGKTTSMAAMVDVTNDNRNAHILTIEDPIEFLHKSKKAVFSQREIGVDVLSFSEGVKDALRQRPDIIVIGEIRDKETAEQALIAGESGHLVIGTLHASSAIGTISKILGFFNADERASRLQSLSGSLVGVINQTLIPKKNGDGYALAVDFLANHKRQYSRFLGEPDKITSMMSRKEDDGVSIPLADSILKLIADGVIDKVEAARAVSGNAAVYDKIRNA